MIHFRSLPVIAIRRMAGNWRLLLSVVIGTIVAAATLSSTAIYSDAIRDLGLDFALEQQSTSDLDLKVLQSNQGVDRVQYSSSRDVVDRGVAAALGDASSSLVRMGTSGTFYPAAPGAVVDFDDAGRDRSVLRFRSELEREVEVIFGEFPRAIPSAGSEPIPVAIGLETATGIGVDVGQRFDIYPFWDEEAAPLRVEVVGIIQPIDPNSRYWGGGDEVIDRHTRSWNTLAFIVPEATFFGAMVDLAIGVSADYDTLYQVETGVLNSRNGPPLASAVSVLERALSGDEVRLHVETALVEVLDTYDEKLFFTRLPLLVLLLQIGGIVAYYLVMVSTMLVERQASELALLRSRGATTAQLLFQYGIEGLLLAVVAAATGPPIAAAVIAALGRTPEFASLSGGGLLEVNISSAAYLLALGGAVIAFSALMLPSWRATRRTMVDLKQSTARPRATPLFMRYYLDVALVMVSAVVFWQLSQQEELFTESLFGDVQVDPFLLLTPSVFLLTVGIVFLRLFPVVLRLIAAVVGKTNSVAVLVGMRSLVRNPGHYTRLILLLMFATGVGMFGASFRATLQQSYDDRASYSVGADVRAGDLRTLTGGGEIAFRTAVSDVPATAVASIARIGGRITTQSGFANIEFLGIDSESIANVGYFREDFSEQTLNEIATTLKQNQADLQGVPIPVDARQIGIWVKAPDIRGPVRVGIMVRDANGRYFNALFAELGPDDPTSEEWRFISRDILEMTERFGPVRGESLINPLTLHAYFIQPQGNIARSFGRVLFGSVLATAAEPAPPTEDDYVAEPIRTRRDQAPAVPDAVLRVAQFDGAVLVKDFSTIDGFEVIRDFLPYSAGDSATSNPDGPPGFERSTRLDWSGVSVRQPVTRGLRQVTDGELMAFYLDSASAALLELDVGDRADIFSGQKYSRGILVGTFEFFPTTDFGPNAETIAVVDLSRLLAVNNASPSIAPAAPTEVWYATDDPTELRSVLDSERFRPSLLMDIDSTRLLQQEDPLVAAGWQGILAIAFGAVLLLSAIGFLVYSYLTAQQRALEFAILRTLGFSRWQVFSLVTFEHLFVIVTGMGLGTVVGIQVGRMMMNFLGTDERGQEVFPPFVLGISWPSVFVAWGVLGSVFVVTIGAVVLLYWRLAVHRALRIGDA
jgi:hypothetical protein